MKIWSYTVLHTWMSKPLYTCLLFPSNEVTCNPRNILCCLLSCLQYSKFTNCKTALERSTVVSSANIHMHHLFGHFQSYIIQSTVSTSNALQYEQKCEVKQHHKRITMLCKMHKFHARLEISMLLESACKCISLDRAGWISHDQNPRFHLLC